MFGEAFFFGCIGLPTDLVVSTSDWSSIRSFVRARVRSSRRTGVSGSIQYCLRLPLSAQQAAKAPWRRASRETEKIEHF